MPIISSVSLHFSCSAVNVTRLEAEVVNGSAIEVLEFDSRFTLLNVRCKDAQWEGWGHLNLFLCDFLHISIFDLRMFEEVLCSNDC